MDYIHLHATHSNLPSKITIVIWITEIIDLYFEINEQCAFIYNFLREFFAIAKISIRIWNCNIFSSKFIHFLFHKEISRHWPHPLLSSNTKGRFVTFLLIYNNYFWFSSVGIFGIEVHSGIFLLAVLFRPHSFVFTSIMTSNIVARSFVFYVFAFRWCSLPILKSQLIFIENEKRKLELWHWYTLMTKISFNLFDTYEN